MMAPTRTACQSALGMMGFVHNPDVAWQPQKAPKANWFQWSSKTEVAVVTNAEGWNVEARIPVTESTEDPLHLVVGRRPSADLPWYFNLCRKRARGKESESMAFSPTGTNSFHEVMKFGKLFVGG